MPLADSVKLLGVTLDSHLTMDDHISAVCRACVYHIRALRHIRPAITDDVAKTVACAIVGARLDYANSVLYGTSQANIYRLQRTQNLLARVVVGRSVSLFHSSPHILRHLHWLPVYYRINFKLAKFAYRAIHSSSCPSYLVSLLTQFTPACTLRSGSSNLLCAPSCKLQVATRGFRVATPSLFNSLPQHVRSSPSLNVFSKNLKTFFFTSTFSAL